MPSGVQTKERKDFLEKTPSKKKILLRYFISIESRFQTKNATK